MAVEDSGREERAAQKYGVTPERVRESQGSPSGSDEYWRGRPRRATRSSVVGAGIPVTRRDTPLSLILGGILLLLIVGLLLFYRTPRQHNQISQTTVETDTTTPQISEADTAGIPELTQAEKDSMYFAAAVPKPAPVTYTPQRSRRPRKAARITTSSSLNAYQDLASLKAEGVTRARMKTVRRRGVTLYQVVAN